MEDTYKRQLWNDSMKLYERRHFGSGGNGCSLHLWIALTAGSSSSWPMEHSIFVSSHHTGWFIDGLDLKVQRLLVPKGNSLQCRTRSSVSFIFLQC